VGALTLISVLAPLRLLPLQRRHSATDLHILLLSSILEVLLLNACWQVPLFTAGTFWANMCNTDVLMYDYLFSS